MSCNNTPDFTFEMSINSTFKEIEQEIKKRYGNYYAYTFNQNNKSGN